MMKNRSNYYVSLKDMPTNGTPRSESSSSISSKAEKEACCSDILSSLKSKLKRFQFFKKAEQPSITIELDEEEIKAGQETEADYKYLSPGSRQIME